MEIVLEKIFLLVGLGWAVVVLYKIAGSLRNH